MSEDSRINTQALRGTLTSPSWGSVSLTVGGVLSSPKAKDHENGSIWLGGNAVSLHHTRTATC